jgi:hypothetical protein
MIIFFIVSQNHFESVLGLLLRVGVGDAVEFSKLHGASIFCPEDGGSMYFRNFCNVAHSHTVLQLENSKHH